MPKIQEHVDESENNADLKNTSEEGEKDTAPQRFRRMLGSWIFESVGGFYLPTENVSKLSVKKQEQLLIRDLIYAFSGVPSSHIRPVITKDEILQLKTEHIDLVRFKIDESFSGAFRSLANELLPLIGYYINVQTFIEDTIMSTGSNRILGMALHKHMQQYFEAQSSLETQLQEHKLNLQQLVQQLRPWLLTMESYANLTSQARRLELNRAQLLSLMDEHQQRSKSDRVKHLITDVARYYMKIVQLWTQKGVLYDVRGEFFIEDTIANAMSSTLLSPKQCCYGYWVQRYRVHRDRLPSFLEPLAERILLAGKYLNVLRQCNVQMKLMQVPLIYLPQDEAHVGLINSSYELPARKLLEVLQNQELKQHLQNLQGYFLLQHHNFIARLMNKCAKQLQSHVDNVIPEKLHQLTLEALQHCIDPHKHMLRCHLLNCDVATQLSNRLKRLNPELQQELKTFRDTSSETEASSEMDTSSELPEPLALYGYEAFTLRYEPSWPISLVIHDEPLEQLQLLHRVLFYLRYVQHQLNASTCYKHYRSGTLHQRMIDCMQQLEQHMIRDIVEPHWVVLLLALDKAQHIDELIAQFQSTLDQCLSLCLLSEPLTFVRSLFTLGQLCLNYCDFKTQDELESGVDEFEEQFNSLLSGILALVNELAKPNSACGKDERASCEQLLQRLDNISKDLIITSTSSEL